MEATRRLVSALVVFVLVLTGGTVGYVLLGDASWLDALYMTLISVTTVGFGEMFPLDAGERALTMAVIVLGVGSVTVATVTGIEFLVEGHLRDIVGRRRMERQLDRLHGHVIVCGFGRVGREVADSLHTETRDVAVVDIDDQRLALAGARGLPYVQGDASYEEVLLRAGADRAFALVAATDDDAENVLITLTAKGVARELFVVVRIKDEESGAKARRAGADRVLAPTAIGGRRIAALVSRPHVVDFLDVVTHGGDVDVVLEEVVVRAGSPLAGRPLSDGTLRERYAANVVALRAASDRTLTTRLAPERALAPGDVLIVMGARADLDRLQRDAG